VTSPTPEKELPIQAHSKTEYKRLVAQGANVIQQIPTDDDEKIQRIANRFARAWELSPKERIVRAILTYRESKAAK